MVENLMGVQDALTRSKDALNMFKDILTPTIENAKDDHERLYWHHIFEEEEHRFDRLEALLPKLHQQINNNTNPSKNNGDYIRLLQDISLEKFGLHNFLEHLDLSLFHFKNTEHEPVIEQLRNMTATDYQNMKRTFEALNQGLDNSINIAASIPTDEKEHHSASLKIQSYIHDHDHHHQAPVHRDSVRKNSLTVGNLKRM